MFMQKYKVQYLTSIKGEWKEMRFGRKTRCMILASRSYYGTKNLPLYYSNETTTHHKVMTVSAFGSIDYSQGWTSVIHF
jgi:hypothetical protein